MSDNKENKAIENNNSALKRPGASASMAPEITETKEVENKAPLQDIDSPFKASPFVAAPAGAEDKKPVETTAPAKASEPQTKKKTKKNKKDDIFKDMTEEEAEEEIKRIHKRRKRRAVTLVAVVVVLAAGAILLPNLLKFVAPKVDVSAVNVNQQTLEYKVAKTSIVRDFTASGTLAAGDTEDIKIAGDIEVEEFFVKNGDVISKGDKIASVSKPSVMSAIVELQKTLKSLDTKLNKINTSDDKTVIKADSNARVKKIYAKKGSNAENVISANGALILLSLDGLMACDIEKTSDTRLGANVTVVLSNKTKVSGSIISVGTDHATCAISDKKAAYKDKVTVLDANGKEIGSSELYIHSVLPVIAYSGKVSSISVKVNQTVKKGTKLLTLTGTRYSGEYSNLMYKRSVLEDQMKTLFELYQTGIIYSDHDGEVAGIKEDDEEEEEESAEKTEKLSSSPKKLSSLSIKVNNANANPPVDKDASGFVNYAFVVGGFNTTGNKTTFNLNSDLNVTDFSELKTYEIKDYKQAPTNISLTQYKYTVLKEYAPDVPIYSYDSTKKIWNQVKADKIAMGDTLIITLTAEGEAVWIIRYPASSSEQGGGKGGQGGNGGEQGGGNGGQGGWNGGKGGRGGNFDWSSLLGGKGGAGLTGRNGLGGQGYNGAGSGSQTGTTEKKEETYEMEETLIASIVNLDTMSVTLSVDELDVININKTQEVTVTLDAIKDKSYKGSIVSIDSDGTRSGSGNAKYSVKISLDRTDDMLTNMSASVRANISTAEVISVPAEALIEKGSKTYCYTSYDKENDVLLGEVEVKTGISDGKNVEIVSGLNEGDAVWYKYADGLVYKFVR